MGIVSFDEGGGFSSVFDLDRGVELSFTQPPIILSNKVIVDDSTTRVPDTQAASIAASLGLSPEVAAGLNQETLARIAGNQEQTSEFLRIQQTRPGISENVERITDQISPEVVAGLNPAAINRVANSDEMTDRFVDLSKSRPINEKPSLLDKITNPITDGVKETQATVKRAIVIFLILLVVVVAAVLGSLYV